MYFEHSIPGNGSAWLQIRQAAQIKLSFNLSQSTKVNSIKVGVSNGCPVGWTIGSRVRIQPQLEPGKNCKKIMMILMQESGWAEIVDVHLQDVCPGHPQIQREGKKDASARNKVHILNLKFKFKTWCS
jgi:hypothetical protein